MQNQQQPIRILFLEDVPADMGLAERALAKEKLSFVIQRVQTEKEFVTGLKEFHPDLIISDYSLPVYDGMRALRVTLETDATIPFILLTGSMNEEVAVSCIKAGATDYVLKERLARLPFAVKDALAQKKTRIAKEEAERALRENEQRYRSLIEHSADGIALMDRQGIFQYLSPASEKMFGFAAEDVIGKSGFEFVHPDDIPKAEESFHQVLQQSSKPITFEMRCRRKDGVWSWFEMTGTNLLDDSSIQSIVVNYRDISERKLADQSLKESEERFRLFMDNSPATAWIKDERGRYVYLSKKHQKYATGVESWRGKTDNELFPREIAEQYMKNDRLVSEKNDAVDVIEESLSPNGERGYWWNFKFPLQDGSGAKFVGGIGIDITERRLAEEKARASEANYSYLFANMREGFAHCRMIYENNRPVDFIYLNVNKAFAELTGLRDVIGKKVSEVIPGIHESNPELLEIYGRTATTGEPAKFEGYLPQLALWLSVSVYSPQKDYFVAVFDNITDRKQAAESLRLSEEKFRSMIEQSSEGVALIGEDGKIIEWNRAQEQITGLERGQVIGTPFWDVQYQILPPDRRAGKSPDSFKQMMGTAFQTGQLPGEPGASREVTIQSADGHLRTLLQLAFPIRTDTGYRIGAIFRDITETIVHRQEMDAIAAVSLALRDASSRAEMLSIVLDQVVSMLQAQAAAFVLSDPATGELVVEASRGALADALRQRIPAGEGVTGQVVKTAKPYVNNQGHTESLILQSANLGELQAIACVPLIAQKQTIGGLWIGRQQAIEEDQVRMLSAVADIAANAIRRASLHEQTQRQVERLDTLHSIDAAIVSSFDVRVILNILLQRITTQLSVDAADVLLLNRHSLILEYAAGRGFRSPGVEKCSFRLGEGYAGVVARETRAISFSDFQAQLARENNPKLDYLRHEGFVSYYAVPLVVKANIRGVMELFRRTLLPADPDWIDFVQTLAQQAAIAIDNAELFASLQRSSSELGLAYDATIEGWSRAIELREMAGSQGHTTRIAELAMRLARELGLKDDEIVHVRRGAFLHDIGKIGLPDRVLGYGKRTDEEAELFRKHPQIAYDLLSPIAYLRPSLDIPYCHHENWDGTGYPQGLKGEQIPLSARLFVIVDVWDALTHDRPHRKAWTKQKAVEYIRERSGKQFDPDVVKVFLQSVILA